MLVSFNFAFRKLVTFGGLLVCAMHVATAQKAAPARVLTAVDQMPRLPSGGGTEAIVQAIQQRLVYPANSLRAQVEGRIFISFIVETSGRVGKINVVKSLVPECDSAAIRAIQQLPRFTPGRHKGRVVRVAFTVPVTFRIADE